MDTNGWLAYHREARPQSTQELDTGERVKRVKIVVRLTLVFTVSMAGV